MQQGILRVKTFLYQQFLSILQKSHIMDISCFRDLLVSSAVFNALSIWDLFSIFTSCKVMLWCIFFLLLRISVLCQTDWNFKKNEIFLLLFYLIQMNQVRSIIRRKHALRSSLNGGWTLPFTSPLLYSKEKFASAEEKRSYKIGHTEDYERIFFR